MTFVLKFEQAGQASVLDVAGIEDALALVTEAHSALENPTLYFEPKQTYCALQPGVSLESVAQELDSQWVWAADDTLKVHPTLKAKYQLQQ